MGYNEFNAVFGPLREIKKGETIMEFRNETITTVESKPGKPDKDTGEPTFQLIVRCQATGDNKYGNRYSNFFTQGSEAEAFNGLEPEDYINRDVQIGFTVRDYKDNRDGKWKKAKDLQRVAMRDRDINDDVDSERPVLEPQVPSRPPLNEKTGEGEGRGTPEPQRPLKTPVSRDLSIIRQVSWKCSVELMKALEPVVGENMEKNLEWAVRLAHAIEEDICRS